MTTSDSKKTKEKKEEVDFTNVTPDDIARRFLESPPKPKSKKKEE
jgi:hypothetical protein